MIVGWTGHRPEVFRDATIARARLEAAARELVAGGEVEQFLVGGQRGVDAWAAQAAIGLGVPMLLILPIEADAFAAGWSPAERAVLDQTIACAVEVRLAADYTERNRQLATGADLLIAVWAAVRGGGTAETIVLARAAGTPVREIRLEATAGAESMRGRGI